MVTYNKDGVTKKGDRILYSGGPRDRQRKLFIQNDLKELSMLKEVLQVDNKNITGYTREQVDEMINKAIEEVSIDLEKKYIDRISFLEDSISFEKDSNLKLNEKLDKKDSMILELTNKIYEMSNRSSNVYTNTQNTEIALTENRPSIDKVYIDPTKKGSENNYESHINVPITESSKPVVASNVDKLKAIMGTKLLKI